MKSYDQVTGFEELLELEHGKVGTPSRNEYEENAQMFIISEMQHSTFNTDPDF